MTGRTVTYTLSANITQFTARMRQAGSAAAQLGNQLTAGDQAARRQREALSDLGDQAGKVGLVAAAGLGAAVMAAANFDQAMSGVQAATHESTANMEALRAAAIKAGADTAFSATEAAAGIENLAKAGVSTRDILGGGLSGALDLAAAGEIGVAEAAETAATAMTQFGLAGSDVPHIADLLAAAAGKAQGEVSDYAQALNQAGLISDQVGLSIEETTGALAAFGSAGLLGSDAGTSFKTMLMRLNPSTKEAGDLMERVGLSAYDAQGNFVGLSEYAGRLRASLKDMSAEQRTAALQTMFGSDAIRAANILYEQGGKGIDKWITKVNDQGYAAETAAIKLDNLKGDLEALGGSFETALIGMGEGTQGPLRSAVQGVTKLVNAFNELPPAAQGVATGFLAITAVTGGGLFLGAKVIQGIATTRAALVALNITLGPSGTLGAMRLVSAAMTGLALGGVAVATAGVVALGDKMLDVNLTAQQTKDALSDLAAGDVNDQLANLSVGFDSLGDALSSAAFDDLGAILPDFMSSVDEVEELDAALVKLAQRNPGKAAEAFVTIREEAEAAGVPFGELIKLFPQLDAAMGKAGRSLAEVPGVTPWMDMGSGVESTTKAIDKVGDAAQQATSKVGGFKTALEGVNGLLDRRAAYRNQEEAVHAFTVELRENGKALNGQRNGFNRLTEAGREQEAMFDNIISTTAQVAEHLHGLARVRYIDTQIKQARQMARELGLPKPVVDVLIGALQDLGRQKPKPKADLDKGALDRGVAQANGSLTALDRRHVSPSVSVNTSAAASGIRAIQSQLGELRDKTVNVTVNRIARGVPQTQATGGYITGPGTATSDSIPAMLSNGEYVIRAAAVDRYGEQFFHRLNAMRYAQGGLVPQSGGSAASASVGPVVASLSDRDIQRLAAAMYDATYGGTSEGNAQASAVRDRRVRAAART